MHTRQSALIEGEVTLTPTSHLGFGWGVWREMGREIVRARELTWRLFVRGISARYRQSVLGYFWALVPAVVTVVTFTFLNRTRILPIGDTDLPYPLYVLLGMTVWQLFSQGATVTTQSLVSAGNLITKINFSRESLVIGAFGLSLFDFAIRGVLVAAVFVWYQVVPSWTVLLLPAILVPLCLLTVGLGFLLAMTNAVFRDIGSAVSLLMMFGMFLAPVVYPTPTEWPKVLINYLNPVSPFIIATRDLTTRGYLTQPDGLIMASVLSAVVFVVAWRVFHLAMPRIAERI